MKRRPIHAFQNRGYLGKLVFSKSIHMYTYVYICIHMNLYIQECEFIYSRIIHMNLYMYTYEFIYSRMSSFVSSIIVKLQR